jgi:hypothetical protein
MSEPGTLEDHLGQHFAAFCADYDGTFKRDASPPAALLPGSFNPLHAGHLRMAEVTAALIGAGVDFELSIVNVDKPQLGVEDVRLRLSQFHGRARVWVTRAATFEQKAVLFPGTTFIIGADTAQRLIALRYYGGEERRMQESFARIRGQRCRFLVAGREDSAGRFVALEDLALPSAIRDLFAGIPKALLAIPLSSSALRARPRLN